MENCIFCKIVKGEVPSNKVYEDDEFVAFLDINPVSPGHVLVCPKEHYRWVWDVPNISKYFEIVRKIAFAQRRAFDTDWILSNVVGDEVEHAHVWVFPDRNVKGEKKDFAGNANKIKESLV